MCRKQGILLSLFIIVVVSIINCTEGLCIGGKETSCLTELSAEETNATLEYVLSKYEQVEMQIVGQLISVYGLRLTHHRGGGEDEEKDEEVNLHFKYVDNTPHDIIQNCVIAIYHSSSEEDCERIETICNTFLPITPRPLMQRATLRVCSDDDVQLVEDEQVEAAAATAAYTTDIYRDDETDEETVTKPFRTVESLTTAHVE